MSRLLRSFLPLLVLLPPPLAALQRTLRVAPGSSIQAAIDGAADGDMVLVAAGVYFEALDFRGKAVEVVGAGGPTGTILDATGLGTSVVRFGSGEGPRSILQGFTVTGGLSLSSGGGILGVPHDPASTMASPTIRDCIVRGNKAPFRGGGIHADATLERCSVFDNRSLSGAGVSGSVTMKSCVVARNIALLGGGLEVLDGLASLSDCVFLENVAEDSAVGGGVLVGSGASLAASGCLFAWNRADTFNTGGYGFGGAVASFGTAELVHCTVVENRAFAQPPNVGIGGVSGATVSDSIVRDNEGIDLVGSAAWSNVEGGAAGIGNFDLDPAFARSADGDFHLRATSPCIDAGNPALLDPDGTRSDVGAFHFRELYPRANTTPASWSDPAWPAVSLRTGGRVELGLLFGPSRAGRVYRVLGTSSGPAPGIVLSGVRVPLNPDAYTSWSFHRPSTPPLAGFLGVLDADGRATASLRLAPAQPAGLAGRALHHVAGVFVPVLLEASAAADLQLVR